MEEEKKEDALPQVEEGNPTPNEGSPSEIKAPEIEYTKERFDGLMSLAQTEKQARLELERKLVELETKLTVAPQEQVSDEDRWFDYISTKLEEKRKAKETAEEETARKELEQVQSSYPSLKGDDILERAIKYKIDLRTAAEILQDMQSVGEAKTKINQNEEEKKRKAGGLGGGGATTTQKGLTGYDHKLSLTENIMRGKSELGI